MRVSTPSQTRPERSPTRRDAAPRSRISLSYFLAPGSKRIRGRMRTQAPIIIICSVRLRYARYPAELLLRIPPTFSPFSSPPSSATCDLPNFWSNVGLREAPRRADDNGCYRHDRSDFHSRPSYSFQFFIKRNLAIFIFSIWALLCPPEERQR